MAAFPKLIVDQTKQHTFVETDSLRYIYQPIDELILVLITTKGSNIMEDLTTLRLLSKLIPEYGKDTTEGAVIENAFDLVFAFDETLTYGGHKETITLNQIDTNLV